MLLASLSRDDCEQVDYTRYFVIEEYNLALAKGWSRSVAERAMAAVCISIRLSLFDCLTASGLWSAAVLNVVLSVELPVYRDNQPGAVCDQLQSWTLY